MFGKIKALAKAGSRKAKLLALVAVGMMVSVQASALDIVSKDGTTGDVTFNPTALTDPISNGVIVTICAVAGIFLIVIGCRWVFRLCRGGA